MHLVSARRRSTKSVATLLASALVALTVGAVSAAPANAAVPTASWGPETVMSANGADVQIAASSDGKRAVAAWVSSGVLQTNAATIVGNVATWGSPVQVSTTGETADNPDIAVSASGGQAVVVWQERTGSGAPWIPRSAAGLVSGTTTTWGATNDFTAGTTSGAGKTRTRISADGTRATYLWRSEDVVQSASAVVNGLSQTTGAVTTFDTPDTSTTGQSISLAMSRDGSRTAAMWVNGFNDDSPPSEASMETAHASVSGNSASWSTPTTISTNAAGDTYPDIEMSDDGTTIAAIWKQFGTDDALEVPVSASASWNSSVNWGTLTQLAPNNIEVDVVTLGLSADGKTALAIYEDQVTVTADGTVASRSAAIAGSVQTWGPEETPTGTGDIDEMDTALSADGRVGIAVWEGNLTVGDSLNGAAVDVDGSSHTWGVPEQLTDSSDEGVYPEVALSRGGCLASTIWSSDSSFPSVSRSATLTCASPTATAVSPNSGPTDGGTEITITGTGFYPGASVMLGGKACTNVQVVSPTKITCVTPSAPKGAVDVTVTNDDGQVATLSKAFTYIPTTKLTVKAISKNKEVPVRKRTTVVKKATSNGKKTIKVVCKVKGKKVTGALGRQVCGTSVNATTGRVSLAPRCQVSATVVITAKKKGAYATDWRRTWTTRSARGDIAWLPKACLS